jgi:hypothetical protein
MNTRTGVAPWVGAALEAARRALWFPGLVFAAHVVASRFFLAYEVFPPLDIPMHIAGGFAIAFFFHISIEVFNHRRLIREPDGVSRSVAILALVSTSTVFWEFAEYVSDHTIGTHSQAGLEDTLFDMLLGMVGGVIFVLVVAARARNDAAL